MNKKSVLGRGLGALIPNEIMAKDIITDDDNKATCVDINLIKNSDKQPRKFFDDGKIAELAQSIKEHGIIQPIVLNKEDDNYVIVAGERRWRAAKLLNLKEVPATIMNLDDKDILEISLIENIQRKDLNPIEEALAYKRLLDEFNLTQEKLSERLGKSRTSIANIIRLTNLCEAVKQYLIDEVISEGHGKVLLSIEDESLQSEIAQKVIDENLSVRDLEKLIKQLANKKEEKKKESQREIDPYYKDAVDRMQNHFGTKVNISSKANKGKIEIEYYSNEDLQRILDIMEL